MKASAITMAMLAALMGTSPAALPAEPSARAVVEAMFAAFNRHDARAMATLYAADARLTSSDFCAPRVGQANVERTYQALFDEFPDITDHVDLYIVEGNHVAVRFISRSTLTGKAFTLPIVTFLTVRGGLIQSDDSTFDNRGRSCVV
jgi:ketosteroid isomerase-like protein